jgi:PhzF family phenazine biosynthesis protein
MATRIVQVDAFTHTPFKGNPAGVCILERPAPDQWMRDVAREMNLAETAFLLPEGEAYRLRWFTPTDIEMKLCGHATLASAHVLWQEGNLAKDKQARFQTLSGLLTADLEDGWIRLDFPAVPAQPEAAPDGLLESLGVANATYVGKNAFDYIVEVDSDDVVKSLNPDHSRLRTIKARGVMVTARSSDPKFDFISRFFAPGSGIDEDAVTGSAHCCLTPYWSAKLGKQDMMAYQASPRGGVMKVAARGDRVWLSGQAVTVLTGELTQDP